MPPVAQHRSAHQTHTLCVYCVVSTVSLAPPHLYATTGTTVHQWDVRNMSSALWSESVADDEINAFSLARNKAKLAVCDDTGAVVVFDTTTRRTVRKLKAHKRAVCMATLLRPKQPWQVG